MKKNTLKYVKYPSFHELIGVPLFTVKAIKRLIKKEKIEDSLDIIIEKSRQKANEMSEKEHSESDVALLEDDFKAFDDLFAKKFKSKQATKMCFEERIKYCLEKYREQSRNLSSATNSLILEENFLKGAQRILPLYFFFQNPEISVYSKENKAPVNQIHNNFKIEQNITNHLTKNVDNSITNYKIEQNNLTQNVDNSVTNYKKEIYQIKDEIGLKRRGVKAELSNNKTFEDIFVCPKNSNVFLTLLEKRFKNSKGEMEVKNILVAAILNELRIRKVIKNISDTEIRKALESLGIRILKSTFSTGKRKKIDTRDLDLLDELFPFKK